MGGGNVQFNKTNGVLDHPVTLAEISHVVKTIKNNKSIGLDGIVSELVEYGGKPMCGMLLVLFNLNM